MDILRQYKKPLIFFFIVGLVIISGLFIYRNFFTLSINGTSPSATSVSSIQPQVVVSFNKTIKPESVTVASESVVVSAVVDGNKVRVNLFSGLISGEKATIILSAESTDGYKLDKHTIEFTPTGSEGSLTERDNKLILARQETNKSPALQDPIFGVLPASTLDYSITHTIDHADTEYERISIIVAISLSAADSRTDKIGAFEAAKQSAKDFLQSKVNLEDYSVVYVLAGEGL